MIKIIDINFLNEKAAIGCFLIKDNDDLVLIETGPSTYYDSIKNSLNKINIDINRIKNVLVTHIHLDHSGGAWKFSKPALALLNSVDAANFFTRIELTGKFLPMNLATKSAVYPSTIPNQYGNRRPTPVLPFNFSLTCETSSFIVRSGVST